MFEDKDFEILEETPVQEEVVNEEEICDADFTLTQIDESVHEQNNILKRLFKEIQKEQIISCRCLYFRRAPYDGFHRPTC